MMAEPRITDEDVRGVAAALRQRWGPCEHYECDDDAGTCHVPAVREVLTEAVAQRFPLLAVEGDALDVAWHVICAYADLPPEGLPGMHQRMVVSKTHLSSALARVTPLIVADAFERLAAQYPADVFTEDGATKDAISGTALRTVLLAQARLCRDITTGDAS